MYRRNDNVDRAIGGIEGSKNAQYLGHGTYGSAHAHRNRPNSVIKTGAVQDAERDGYLRYIRTIGKLADSNPYFPRVYSIKIMKNDHENAQGIPSKDMYVAEIERLEKCEKMPAETMLAIGDRAFFDFEQTFNAELRYALSHRQGKGSPTGRRSKFEPKYDHIPQGRLINSVTNSRNESLLLITTISEQLQQAVKGDMTNVKDPLLKYALMAIKKLSRSNDSTIRNYYDFKNNNLMCRVGPTGGQLVLIDPIV